MDRKPLVSVLVHTKDSQRTVLEHLKSIKNQSYRDIEIIVVDNNSTDDTVNIAKKFTDKIFNYGPERSAQRNFAAKKASGDFYLVPDSDMILEKDVILECVEKVTNDSEIKAIVICEKTKGIGFWVKCKSLERSCYIGDDIIEAARFFEKNVFWEMGGYDEDITGPEDWDLPQRIKKKYKIGRIKSQIVHDEGKVTLLGLIKKKYYYAKKVSIYLRKHPLKTTGTQIIYLLRPAFYKNWKKLLKNPIVTCGMIVMLFLEQVAGIFGFLLSNSSPKSKI